MLSINCPWCGPRDDVEFHYGGEAHILRPHDASALTDEEFAEYLFMQQNPKGPHLERWVHSQGCRRWFHVMRNTATNEILEVYSIGELPHTEMGKTAYQSNWRRDTAAESNRGTGEDA